MLQTDLIKVAQIFCCGLVNLFILSMVVSSSKKIQVGLCLCVKRIKFRLSCLLGCPAGYTFYDHTGKCYKAVWNGGGILRSDAQKECAAEGGHLASIHDAKTNEFLLGLIQVRSYIGGIYENGQWKWSDGSAWDYENWRAGDPKNSAVLKYAEFDWTKTGVWHNEDNIIGYDNGYICQIAV